MFTVKKEEHISKTFRMPETLVERLAKIAQINDISMNQLVVQCCEYALANMKPEENGDNEETQ